MREGKSRKGRWVLWPSLLGAISVLGVLGYRLAMEEWWIRQLASPNAEVRAHAAEELAEMDSGRAIGPLMRAVAVLQNDKAHQGGRDVTSVREALLRIAGPEDRGTLHGLLKDPDAAVKGLSVSLLGFLPRDRETLDRLVALLEGPPTRGSSSGIDARLSAAFSLGGYGRSAIPILRKLIQGSMASADGDLLGSASASVLGSMGPNAREAFPAFEAMQFTPWLRRCRDSLTERDPLSSEHF